MKRHQVPQDDDRLMDGRGREVCYAVDEEGNYVRELSVGWEPKNAALQQAWEQIHEEVRAAEELVRTGKASPLVYFMAKNMFDVKLLSQYTGIPKRKIKAHLEPESFRRMDPSMLEKYAEALDISPEELRKNL